MHEITVPTHNRKNSGLKRNAALRSSSVQASKLRVQPHAGQGRPVINLMAQRGQGKDQCEMHQLPASIRPSSASTATGLKMILLRGNGFAAC